MVSLLFLQGPRAKRMLNNIFLVGGTVAGNTTTVSVKAGSSVTFGTDQAVYHDGPVSVYMAKAPTTAAEFDGSGEVWFKILDIGPKFPGGTWDLRGSQHSKLSCLNAD
jgi:Auxiliary Activity family 9 (formerly GH61)